MKSTKKVLFSISGTTSKSGADKAVTIVAWGVAASVIISPVAGFIIYMVMNT